MGMSEAEARKILASGVISEAQVREMLKADA